MAESHNRTLICSVLFVDIVEYSRKPVVEQIALKDRFNELLSHVLRDIPVSDRIILDTGDGAAISFIGDPEDALFVAADLRDLIAKETEAIDLELGTRMGVNLGPVRLVKDINGQPNIIGDGINVAQRVMSFAKTGQVLVSRSYFEVVSRLSEESSKLFTYEGSRTDKHIREHEVYGVGDVSALRRRGDEPGTEGGSKLESSLPGNPVARTIKGGFERVSARPRLATTLAVTAILATAVGARMLRSEGDDAGSSTRDAAAVEQAPSVSMPAYVATEEPRETPAVASKPVKPTAASDFKSTAVKPSVTPVTETRPIPPAPPVRTKVANKDEDKPVAVARVAPPAPPADPAKVSLAISPWGQVFVDGKMRGVSPPLQELELAPGKHRIEVKNASSEAHVVTVNAKPGEQLRIKHKFD